jgi:hypothetical protein
MRHRHVVQSLIDFLTGRQVGDVGLKPTDERVRQLDGTELLVHCVVRQ